MLLAHPAGIKADQRVERSLYQRAVGYVREADPAVIREPDEWALCNVGLKVKESSLKEAARRSCNSMTDSSRCALFNPARPLLELLMGSLSISALCSRYPVSRAL